jgi:Spy/CpxP family protein refolding chaperone
VRARVVLLAAACAVLAGAPAAAQMPEAPPGKWWKRPRVVQMLKLSPEQQDKLEEIFSRNRRSFVDLKAALEKHQIDVEELVAKKDADPKKVSAAVDALEEARMRLRKSVTMMFLEQRAVLTPQQWSQIVERRDDWRRERMEERRRGDMERRGGRRGGTPPGGTAPAPAPEPNPE